MNLEPLKRPIRKLRMLRRSLPTYLHWKWRLRGDSLFSLQTVDRGLAPRQAPPHRTPAQRLEVAERVIAAYQRAASDHVSKSDVYKVSNEWVPLFRKPLKPLLTALESGNAEALRDLLDNFFRNSVSQGLCGLAADMAGTFFDKQASPYLRTQLLIDAVYRYRLLERLVPGVSAADLHIDDIGNPYGMMVDGNFVRTGADYQYYYAWRVSRMLEPPPYHATVVELGGGIGGFAYFLSRLRPAGMTYINLDLPEILCISSYLLLNLLPDARAVLYGEQDALNKQSLSRFDLALLPSFVIESLDENSADVSFNSYSLAEMDRPTIENYTHHLSRVSSRSILHVNHVSNALVGADQFPFDETKFRLVSRTRALWNLGRDLNCDEYEFALERRLT